MAKKKLINLDKGVHITSNQWRLDQDYITTLKQKAKAGDVEASRALEFLDMYTAMELDNNFNNDLGKTISKELRSELTKAREGSRYDVMSSRPTIYPDEQYELENLVNGSYDISEMAEAITETKEKNRQAALKKYNDSRKKKSS